MLGRMSRTGRAVADTAIPTTDRYSFLCATNEHQQMRTWCRLPGCSAPVKRFAGPGRAGWFCSKPCMYEFRRQRQALDDLLERLSERLRTEQLTTRARVALERDINWLLGARSAYVAPSDWAKDAQGATWPSTIDQESVTSAAGSERRSQATPSAVDDYIEGWRSSRVRTRRRSDRCPLCQGSGSQRELVELQGGRGSPGRRRRNEEAVKSYAALHRLLPLIGTLEAMDHINALAEMLERRFHRVLADAEAPRATGRATYGDGRPLIGDEDMGEGREESTGED